MTLKIIRWLGLIACATIIISCFLPWVYYPAVNETFTGFHVVKFPSGNYYGKAGYTIVTLTIIITAFMLIKKVWAKRINFFVAGVLFAYACRTYLVFTGSLFKDEVTRKPGIFLVLLCSAIILVASLFPDDEKKRLA